MGSYAPTSTKNSLNELWKYLKSYTDSLSVEYEINNYLTSASLRSRKTAARSIQNI
jgi:hypothetical protein